MDNTMGQPIRLNTSQKRKRRRRRRLLRIAFLISVIILILVAVVLLSSFLIHQFGRGGTPSGESSAPSAVQTQTSASTTLPTTTAGTTQTTVPAGASNPPSGLTVDPSFFDDTAFIGDSRTEGLMLYTGLENATFYAHKGLNVSSYFTSKVIKSGSEKVTIPDALSKQSFKKVYIMLGVNELGWAYENVFIKQYGDLVDNVKSLQPNAAIYVQSILPVTKAKSDSDAIYNNPKINRYNELLQQMAQEKGVRYVTVNEAVGLDDGALPAAASTDGVHLNKEYCFRWLNYLAQHSS